MDAVIKYLVENGDLKILLLLAGFIGWRGLHQVAAAIAGIRDELKEFRTKEECDIRHGHSCSRLDELEEEVKKNSFSIGEIKGRLNK